ncbi:hypothetical protein Taro_000910 [Colocasia esculenta]|uniref:Uncharacterized protein n=1 Tax=Colocasia esculenta TaxID=4460 RepID=A0A843THS7_COLES|nr:hypothetical protein [Colocasia esculenta]
MWFLYRLVNQMTSIMLHKKNRPKSYGHDYHSAGISLALSSNVQTVFSNIWVNTPFKPRRIHILKILMEIRGTAVTSTLGGL